MKQFWTILQFELKSYFKNKIFIGVTLFLVALIGIVMLFPRFPALADIQAPAELSERPVMLVSAGRAKDPAAVERAFAARFQGMRCAVRQNRRTGSGKRSFPARRNAHFSSSRLTRIFIM